ncbi:UNVERIFIED_CONTAM: hypothetical protein K2H54_005788 [Gekko kuhli]
MDITIHYPWMCRPFSFSPFFPPHLFDQRLSEGLLESALFSDLDTLSPYYSRVPHTLDTELLELLGWIWNGRFSQCSPAPRPLPKNFLLIVNIRFMALK